MKAIRELERLGYVFTVNGGRIHYEQQGERPAPEAVRPLIGYLHRHRDEALQFLQARGRAVIESGAEAATRWPTDPPPAQPCWVSAAHAAFWRRPWGNGGWVCATCHPEPPSLEVETWTVNGRPGPAQAAAPESGMEQTGATCVPAQGEHQLTEVSRTAGPSEAEAEDARAMAS